MACLGGTDAPTAFGNKASRCGSCRRLSRPPTSPLGNAFQTRLDCDATKTAAKDDYRLAMPDHIHLKRPPG